MSLVIAQVSMAADSTLARDAIVNTLHFNDKSTLGFAPTDWQNLANDLAAIYDGGVFSTGSHQIQVRLYDMDDAKPRPIKAQATKNTGLAPQTGSPREVALCLSFYADRNLPRRRGRIYIPAFAMGAPGLRPTSTNRTKLLDLAASLAGLGGIDVEWCVYSRLDNVHYPISDAWVDDEWDTVRSRGLRATLRDTRHVGS
jgi:hypothetical protein